MSSSWSVEVECQGPAGCIFKAGLTDWHNLAPKLLPDIFTGITILSGNGGSGTIRHVDLTPEGPFIFARERFDFVDIENLEAKTTAVEGGNLGKKVESSSFHYKVEPCGNGCIVKLVDTYEPIPGVDYSEDAELLKEVFIRCVKAVDEYVLANPNKYA